jgi:transcriptional regulator with XRE-family HTH domain
MLNGMSQRDLAQRLAELGAPISDSQLSKIERGLSLRIRPRTIPALAAALSLEVTDFLVAEEEAA